jgi:hypothetical protein
MTRLLTVAATVVVLLAPPLAGTASSGPIPTQLAVSGDDSTLSYQITGWALDEIKASKTHAAAVTEAPVLQIRIEVASVVQGQDLVGAALAVLVTTVAGTDTVRVVSLTNQVVPLSMLEVTIRAEIKTLLK